MVSTLYNIGIRAYATLLQLAAPFNQKARQWVEGRRDWQGNLGQKLGAVNPDGQPVVWFHAASLGEFEQGRPVMEAFRAEFPAYKIVLTFFSPSGYEVRKTYAGADVIAYLPADTPENARAFLTIVQPKLAFFIKYEFWANYLHALRAAQVPTISFSAIFRANQLFFKPWGGFYRELLTCFDSIFVQNEESEQLLRSIGITHVTRAGDTRFDRVAQVAAARKEIPPVAEFKKGPNGQPVPLLVVGSAWQADMDVLIPFLNRFEQPLKVIIAPHEIHDDEIERWRGQLKGESVRYSEINERMSTEIGIRSLFIDNIGMLSSLYQYGDFAYIGGAFGKGLHNILEAATFGVPVFFGPNYTKFQEAIDLIEEGGAFSVAGTEQLRTAFEKQYGDRTKASIVTKEYVKRNTGATEKVMQLVRLHM
ncbi:MAG: 3-deoxy-D-manno-octulosonic acid transferase [Cytophagales bacterium]|nr:MAG: 3-deoxy-D-manno-octulosonic acid transferase [Cytophagales bacterium]